jgi:putative transposase
MGMARIARVVVPGIPHHVTQRGNRRMDVFFSDEDREEYLSLLVESGERHGLEFLGYCLMSNHVHLLAVPRDEDSLALGLGRAHERYTRRINFRERWRGYLWQGRFFSCPLDERGAMAVLRYIELNPVRAGLVREAEAWEWSSARGHVRGRGDKVAKGGAFGMSGGQWRSFLREAADEDELRRIRRCVTSGRPMGSEAFVEKVERLVKRTLRPGKPGPKKGSRRGR